MSVFYIITLLTTLLLTALILRFLIPVLKSKKMGQKILDIGPRWHKSKEGTPTMGGLSFIISFSVVSAVMLLIAVYNGSADNILSAVLTGFLALGRAYRRHRR